MFNLKTKQLKIILLLALIVITLLIIYIIFKPRQNNFSSDNNLSVEFSKDLSCIKAQEYIKEEDYSIYIYCINNLFIKDNNQLIDFKEYYQNHPNIISKLIRHDLNPIIYKDGGSIKYIYQNLAIIKCNTLNGNKDIYLGNKDLTYQEDFCQENHSVTEHYATYKYLILNIAPSNEEKYLYLTLRASQGEEVDTVKVSQEVYADYQEDNYYNFTFLLNKDSKTDNINDLFTTTTLTQVQKLD